MNPTPPPASRRDFLKTSAALTAAALVPAVHAAGSDILKIGLIGCGGRGTGAASQALRADHNVKLVAMGDAFSDRLEGSLKALKTEEEIANKIAVDEGHKFVGFDAYKQVIDSGVDVVLLATPPHFRPLHLKDAVEKGKHVFAEKPVAVDGPGVRSVLATCEEAKKKKLSVVSGLCLRYDQGFREAVKRIHDGAIGDMLTMQSQRPARRPLGQAARAGLDRHGVADAQLVLLHLAVGRSQRRAAHPQPRRCGLGDAGRPPVRAIGLGGRQVRTAPEFGHIFDHHSVVYEYANGVKCLRQLPPAGRLQGRHLRLRLRHQGHRRRRRNASGR